jgi:alkanesulfonate monooxygenase SsuD/methylene tetrahydromethanopterin reductase-like flavin-dependent oxidoreductase (luciferase family)
LPPGSAEYCVPGADDEAILADIVRSLGRDRDAVRNALAIPCEIAVGDFAGLDDAKAEPAAMTLLGREGPAVMAPGRTESSSEARAVLQQALSRSYRGMPAEALIAGSVDQVAEQFRTFGKIGYTDILVRHLTNAQPKVLGSLERLAGVRAALA